jgi:hypothetical protein
MRSCLVLALLLAACSSSSSDNSPLIGLWETRIGSSTICQLFCDDGLTQQTWGGDIDCWEWPRFDERQACFPYEVHGDQLEIDGPPGYPFQLSEDGKSMQLTIAGSTETYVRLGDWRPACEQPCYRAGNEDEPLRD